MNSDRNWQPAAQQERFRNIDIIRGLALFGVLMVNVLSDFRTGLLDHILHRYDGLGRVDRLVELAVAFLLEFKALTIFSFLFGVGIAIQMERAQSRGAGAGSFLVRRMAWLLVLGTMHLFLIWNGDILTLYGVCGLLLLPLIRLPQPFLLAAGVVLVALPEFVSLDLPFPSGAAAAAEIARTREVYGHQGFFAILEFRQQETWTLIVPLLISILLRTTGLMCWGVAAWRSGVLREPDRHRSTLTAALAGGAGIGGILTLNEVSGRYSGNAPWPALGHTHLDASMLLALAYVAGLLLSLTPDRASRLTGLACLGQTALTNYLMQSAVLGFIFYGYGLGLFGRLGSAAAAGIGVTLYVLQVQLSRYWLGRFRFGPFEWLWRSLSYGRCQPMRRVVAAATPGARDAID